jgi:hypothetical protein
MCHLLLLVFTRTLVVLSSPPDNDDFSKDLLSFDSEIFQDTCVVACQYEARSSGKSIALYV